MRCHQHISGSNMFKSAVTNTGESNDSASLPQPPKFPKWKKVLWWKIDIQDTENWVKLKWFVWTAGPKAQSFPPIFDSNYIIEPLRKICHERVKPMMYSNGQFSSPKIIFLVTRLHLEVSFWAHFGQFFVFWLLACPSIKQFYHTSYHIILFVFMY